MNYIQKHKRVKRRPRKSTDILSKFLVKSNLCLVFQLKGKNNVHFGMIIPANEHIPDLQPITVVITCKE